MMNTASASISESQKENWKLKVAEDIIDIIDPRRISKRELKAFSGYRWNDRGLELGISKRELKGIDATSRMDRGTASRESQKENWKLPDVQQPRGKDLELGESQKENWKSSRFFGVTSSNKSPESQKENWKWYLGRLLMISSIRNLKKRIER